MTRASILADRLYDMGIGLKRFDQSKLARKKYRQECINDLSAMQYLVHCIGKQRISDDDAHKIIYVLDAYRHPRLQNYAEHLLDADEMSDYSDEYDELSFDMASSLTYCTAILAGRRKDEYGAVCKIMWAFHNAPRAFLSLSHGMRISLQDARNWGIKFNINIEK